MNFQLLIDLHKGGIRQGPGSNGHTLQALELSGLGKRSGPLQIADIGCGTGASTLTLAQALNASISAIDLFPEFLEILSSNANAQNVSDKIAPITCSMEELPFQPASFDAIWSEGAIYNMGFEKGISYFRQFLKPGGVLAVSEITWLTHERPKKLTDHWINAYPEIDCASRKLEILERQGFKLNGYFPLPSECWLENYYEPLENRFEEFLAKHDADEAKALVEAEREEIALYHEYKEYFSYGFYIAETV